MSEWLLASVLGHAWQCALAGVVLLLAARCVRAHRTQQILLAGGLLKFLLPFSFAASFSVFTLVPATPIGDSAVGAGSSVRAMFILAILVGGSLIMLARLVSAAHALAREAAVARRVDRGIWHEELHAAVDRMDLWLIPELRVTDAPDSGPRACGVLRPLILVPASLIDALPRASVRAILMHELAHHRRGDVALTLFANLTVALWWWHPVAWLLARSLRRAAEHACDDVVIAQPDVTRDEYCTALLSAARVCSGGLQPTAGFAEHPLRERLRRIIAGSVAPAGRLAAFAAAAVVLILLPGTPNAPLHRDQDDDDRVIRVVDRTVVRDVAETTERRVIRIPGNGTRNEP